MIKVRNHGDRWETVAAIALDIVQIVLEINRGIENLKQKSKKKKEEQSETTQLFHYLVQIGHKIIQDNFQQRKGLPD